MKGNRKAGLLHGLTAVFAVLLSICLGGTSIANAHVMELNTRLGTSSYRQVAVEGAPVSDGIYFESEFETLEDLIREKEAVAAQIAGEGSVLLKNDNLALPLDRTTERITLWGLNSHNPTLGGMIGSSATTSKDSDQKVYGLEEALTERGFSLNAQMIEFYAGEEASAYAHRGGHGLTPSFGATYTNFASYRLGEAPASLYSDALLASADDTVAVIVLSRDNSEASDYHPDMTNGTKGDAFVRPLALSDYERAMIDLAKQHNNGKVVVLINADNPMEIDELKQDEAIDSILWVGLPGMYGFLGVADVLGGEVNPSGHLPMTFPVSTVSAPAMVNFGLYLYSNASTSETPELTEANKADWYVVESEGIYLGYKYYETRYEDLVLDMGNAEAAEGSSVEGPWAYVQEVSYPFGYGLSYTSFAQELLSVEVKPGETSQAVVRVTNTGDTAGKSVVQLYAQAPYTAGGLEKAAVQLLAFGKTEALAPGEQAELTIEFDAKYMASYDERFEKADGTLGAWLLEKGDYRFTIANGAHEAIDNILAHKLGSVEALSPIVDAEQILPDNVRVWTLDETDAQTYSANVRNAMQDCDLNHYIADAVEYTTRSDWTKGWTPVSALTPTEEMMVSLTNSLYQLTPNGDSVTWGKDNGLQLADFMILDEAGRFSGVLDISDPRWDDLMDQITLEEAMAFCETGGELLPSISMPDTFRNDGPVGFTFDQVSGYAVRWTEDQSDRPTYVASDNPYALYAMNTMPTQPVVAATFNAKLTEREGELMGEDGLWSNENSILAPGLNLQRAPYCARNHEYYSEDAMLTNLLGIAVCAGGRSKGLMMEPKHLAFNHQELNRSGISTWFNEQAGRENELRAFQGACETNAAQGIMSSFNRAGAQFVGGHEGIQIQILRNEWGFQGWITTDMINGADYMTWLNVVFGGGGTCLTDSAYEYSEIGTMKNHISEIKQDAHFQNNMKQAIKYFAYAYAASNTMNGTTAGGVRFEKVMTWWQKALIGADVAFGVLTLLMACLYIVQGIRRKKEAV